MNELLRYVLEGQVQITNPLWNKTRADALELLAQAGLADLLQETISCSNFRGKPTVTPHCGVCYQCVDRRFASLAAGLSEHGLKERYVKEIFRQELPEGDARTTGFSYVRHARLVNKIDGVDEFFKEFTELSDCVLPDDPQPEETVAELISMLRRHSRGVLSVLSSEISAAGEDLAFDRLPLHCLVRPAVEDEEPGSVEVYRPALKLTNAQEAASKSQAFRSRAVLEVTGNTAARSRNVLLVGGNQVQLDDADFVPFLRLCLGLFQSEESWVTVDQLQNGTDLGTDLLWMPQGVGPALGRLRRAFAGRIGQLKPTELIERGHGGRIRLSMHRALVQIDDEVLGRHHDARVRLLLERIVEARKQAPRPRRAGVPASPALGKGRPASQ